MKKTYILISTLLLFLLSACFNNVEAPLSGDDKEHSNQNETKSKEDNTNKNDDIKIEEPKSDDKTISTNQQQKQTTTSSNVNKRKISKQDAEQLVRQYLNLENHPETIIEFDHESEGKYVVHAYDIIERGTQLEHTATRGWYYVDPANGKIKPLFE